MPPEGSSEGDTNVWPVVEREREDRDSPATIETNSFPNASLVPGANFRLRSTSITGFFTVLVEGDDFNEPICDATRSILDGHIILLRELAAASHYPAIDIENSISRLSSKVAPKVQLQAASKMREAWASYRRAQDQLHLGAYTRASIRN